ncbi:hypothetical protein GCM10022224_088450 [Nonomuraea antimicrobica]|uniref:Uncharacterized protein n=1 Tax=Nonomuraea antimicrobica TaxID=561173 RepID=A0ABP7DX34_9ACTN
MLRRVQYASRPRHLVRNTALSFMTVLGGPTPKELPPADLAVAASSGLIGAILIVSFDDIIDLFARTS